MMLLYNVLLILDIHIVMLMVLYIIDIIYVDKQNNNSMTFKKKSKYNCPISQHTKLQDYI